MSKRVMTVLNTPKAVEALSAVGAVHDGYNIENPYILIKLAAKQHYRTKEVDHYIETRNVSRIQGKLVDIENIYSLGLLSPELRPLFIDSL